MENEYEDLGPMIDCVLWKDESCDEWRILVDGACSGDVSDVQPLTEYWLKQEFGTITADRAQLNFGVRVYDDGKLLSLVTDSGAHGTHVAGIMAGYFPGQPELDGVAPGAQLVSIKIGDGRLGSMETEAALERAVTAILANGCQLANMSFGEATRLPNYGRFVRLVEEIVRKHNVVFVSSAGNNGPALTTSGAPGATASAFVSVGASVSPAMMSSSYSMLEELPETMFTWSSRGPTTDGDLGVTVSAPGGAITCVPNWCLKSKQLMNGTSMSSPNACGGIGKVIAALMAKNVAYTSAGVMRAIVNTARPIAGQDAFSCGPGVLQLAASYEALCKEWSAADIHYDVRTGNGMRGIYLRQPYQSVQPHDDSITVKPLFADDQNIDAIEYTLRTALKVKYDGADEDWITVPANFMLMGGGRSFPIKVDPRGLADGSVHYAEVQAIDVDHPDMGPIFTLPITVIRPVRVAPGGDCTLRLAKLAFSPGHIERTFVAVPAGATWANVTVRALDVAGHDAVRCYLHCVQVVSGLSYDDTEVQKFMSLANMSTKTFAVPVVAGHTLEVCLAQFWSSLGNASLTLDVAFHGFALEPSHIVMRAPFDVASVRVASNLRRAVIAPKAELKKWLTTVRPRAGAKIAAAPDAARNTLPSGRLLYQLVLEYDIDIAEDGAVTPRAPYLNDQWLYESSHGQQFWILHDANKRVVAFGDVWPDAAKVKKGKHVLRLGIRHDAVGELEKLKQLPVVLERSLPSPIGLKIYATRHDAMSGGKAFPLTSLKTGAATTMHIAGVDDGQLPSGVKAGDRLTGTVVVGRADEMAVGATKHPKGTPITLTVGALKNKEEDKKEDKASVPVKEAVRDLMLARLSEEKDTDAYNKLFFELKGSWPDHVPLYAANVAHVDPSDDGERAEKRREIVLAADDVISRIDADAVAAFHGRRHEKDEDEDEDEAEGKEKAEKSDAEKERAEEEKKMKMLKEQLIDALFRKARAQATSDASLDDFSATLATLKEWVDVSKDAKYLPLLVHQHRSAGKLAKAVAAVSAALKEKPSKDLHKLRITLLDELEWTQWADQERLLLRHKYPDTYVLH